MKINVIANYFSQFFAAIVGLVVIPSYIQILGKESYGLIGFFGLLVVIFQLLDIGFSPTFTREVARFRGGEKTSSQLWNVFIYLTGFFIISSVIGVLVINISSGYIAKTWLNIERLNTKDAILSIKLIGYVVAIKWISGLFKSFLQGFEKIVHLSLINTIVITLSSIAVIPILLYVDDSIVTYFIVQLIVSIIELTLLLLLSYRLMPERKIELQKSKSSDFKSILHFSFGIAVTSSIWILVTQLDKLLLSSHLTLTEYGYFSLGVLAASGVNMVGGPIRQSVLPRLTKLFAEKNELEFLLTYRIATQVVAVFAFSLSFLLSFFAKDVMVLWLKDENLALNASIFLKLYAITNGLIAVGTFPSLLQYAMGKLKLHILGNVFFVILYLPSLFYFIINYGAMGAAILWLVANILYLLIWVPITNNSILPGINKVWIINDILLILIPCLALNILFRIIRDNLELNKIGLLIFIALVFLLSIITSSILSPLLRGIVVSKAKEYV